MWSHSTWCLVVTFSVLLVGAKVPRQIVYQIRPAPLSAFTSHDGSFLLEDGVTEFQFPTFGLKTHEKARSPTVITTAASESADVDISSSSAASSPSEENLSITNEEISQAPKYGPSKAKPQQQYLQLQPEQIQQIFHQIQPQQQQQQYIPDVGPRYEYKSIEENTSAADFIKTAQSEVITEDKLQSAYSERREKKKKRQEIKEQPPMDASYAFGYETDEAARHEVADPNGNVKGWYTYVDDEGTVRKIIYTAGAGKGFVVLGKEKVKGPPPQGAQQQRKHKSNRDRERERDRSNSQSDYYADTSTLASVKHQKPPASQSQFTDLFQANNWNDLAKAGTSNPPGPTTIIATAEPPSSKKKPVFIVKIRRPVQKEQWPYIETYKMDMADYSSPPSYIVHKHLYDPEPLPVPATSYKSRSRRKSLTLQDVVPSLRKQRIKKYPTPPIYYADDEDDSGDTSNQGSSSSSSSSGEDEHYHESPENSGGGGGSVGGGNLKLGGAGDPDSSYVFGYETDTANRLEKADPFGNVRGSYSYIGSSSPHNDYHSHKWEPEKLKRHRRKTKKSFKSGKILDPDGVKRTVHYIAGGNTGFQVIHASPSVSRGVRLEAPPGYVVRRGSSLRTAESRFPIPITVPQPSAIVYHIHPDSGWKPWEPTLRKKKVKIHRKKLPKAAFENPQREPIVLLQAHTPPDRYEPPSGTGTYFKERVTSAGSNTVTETQIPYVSMTPPISRRRHAPQRGYTGEHHHVQFDDDDSKEQTAASINRHSKAKHNTPPTSLPSSASVTSVHEREPLLYSPTFETMRESSKMPIIPNPIQLQPTQVAVKNRGAPTPITPTGLETSSSNHHPVAFTSDGKLQVDVPTVVIEAIEGKSPSLKDENKYVAVATHQLPEAAALTQNEVPSSSKGLTPTNVPSYDNSASYKVNTASSGSTPVAAASNINIITEQHPQQASTAPRSRRRHHRSKATTPPTSAPVSGASSRSSSAKAIASGDTETTTVMSSSKRLINRLAATDHEAPQQ